MDFKFFQPDIKYDNVKRQKYKYITASLETERTQGTTHNLLNLLIQLKTPTSTLGASVFYMCAPNIQPAVPPGGASAVLCNCVCSLRDAAY